MASSYFMLRAIQQKHKRKQLENTKIESNNESMNQFDRSDNAEIPAKCRICFNNEGCIPIFGNDATPDISEEIRTLGGIEITQNDEYPKYMCNACYDILQFAITFRKCAQKTDSYLRQKSTVTHLNDDGNDSASNDESQAPIKKYVSLQKMYSCKICKTKYNNWNDYVKHKNSKRHKNVRIQCPICHGLLTTQLYKRHLARHQSASHLICDVCGKLYRKDNLVRHLQLHSFELPFQCTQCPYRGRFLESLKIHMRTHTGIKPFSCDMCQLRFLTRSNLNRHLLTHKKDRPYKCVECGRGFYSKSDMDVHFKSDHAGIKDFGCRMCGSKYGTRKALMRHELRVHKRDKMAKGRMPLYLRAEYRKSNEV